MLLLENAELEKNVRSPTESEKGIKYIKNSIKSLRASRVISRYEIGL